MTNRIQATSSNSESYKPKNTDNSNKKLKELPNPLALIGIQLAPQTTGTSAGSKPDIKPLPFAKRPLPVFSAQTQQDIVNQIKRKNPSQTDWYQHLDDSDLKNASQDIYRDFKNGRSGQSYDEQLAEIYTLTNKSPLNKADLAKAIEKTAVLQHWLKAWENLANENNPNILPLSEEEKTELAQMKSTLEEVLDQVLLSQQITYNEEQIKEVLPKIVAGAAIQDGKQNNFTFSIYDELNQFVNITIDFSQGLDGLGKQLAMLKGYHHNLIESSAQQKHSDTAFTKKLNKLSDASEEELAGRFEMATRFFDNMRQARNNAHALAHTMGVTANADEKAQSKWIDKVEKINDLFETKWVNKKSDIDENLANIIKNRIAVLKPQIAQILFSEPTPPAAVVSAPVRAAEEKLHQQLNKLVTLTSQWMSLHEQSTHRFLLSDSFLEDNEKQSAALLAEINATKTWLSTKEAIKEEANALRSFTPNSKNPLKAQALETLNLDSRALEGQATKIAPMPTLEDKYRDTRNLLTTLETMVGLQKKGFDLRDEYEKIRSSSLDSTTKQQKMAKLAETSRTLLTDLQSKSQEVAQTQNMALYQKSYLNLDKNLGTNFAEKYSVPANAEYAIANDRLTPSRYQHQSALAINGWIKTMPAAHRSYFYTGEQERLYNHFHEQAANAYDSMASEIDTVYNETGLDFAAQEAKIQGIITRGLKTQEDLKKGFVDDLTSLGDKYGDKQISKHPMLTTVNQEFKGMETYLNKYRTDYLVAFRKFNEALNNKKSQDVRRDNTKSTPTGMWLINAPRENTEAINALRAEFDTKKAELEKVAPNFINAVQSMEGIISDNMSDQAKMGLFETTRHKFKELVALHGQMRTQGITEENYAEFKGLMQELELTLSALLKEIPQTSYLKEFGKLIDNYKTAAYKAAQAMKTYSEDHESLQRFENDFSKANIIFLSNFQKQFKNLEYKYNKPSSGNFYGSSRLASSITNNFRKLVQNKDKSFRISFGGNRNGIGSRNNGNISVGWRYDNWDIEFFASGARPKSKINGSTGQLYLDENTPATGPGSQANTVASQALNNVANGSVSQPLEQSTRAKMFKNYYLKEDFFAGVKATFEVDWKYFDTAGFTLTGRRTEQTVVTKSLSDQKQYSYDMNRVTTINNVITPTTISINVGAVPPTTIVGGTINLPLSGSVSIGANSLGNVLANGPFSITDVSNPGVALTNASNGAAVNFQAFNPASETLANFVTRLTANGNLITYRFIYNGVANANPPASFDITFQATPNGATYDLTAVGAPVVNNGNVNITTAVPSTAETLTDRATIRPAATIQKDHYTRQLIEGVLDFGTQFNDLYASVGIGAGVSKFKHDKTLSSTESSPYTNNNLKSFDGDSYFGLDMKTEAQKEKEAQIMRDTYYLVTNLYLQYNPKAKAWSETELKDRISAELGLTPRLDVSGNKNSFMDARARAEFKLLAELSIVASIQKIFVDRSKADSDLSIANFSSAPKFDATVGLKYRFNEYVSLTVGAFQTELPTSVVNSSPTNLPQGVSARPYANSKFNPATLHGVFARFEQALDILEKKGFKMSWWAEFRAQIGKLEYDYLSQTTNEKAKFDQGRSSFGFGVRATD
jgi:hypothetical protein